jgi:hypothetical protein
VNAGGDGLVPKANGWASPIVSSHVRLGERGAPVWTSSPVEPDVTDLDLDYADKNVQIFGIPHLAKNDRDMGHPPIRGRDRF